MWLSFLLAFIATGLLLYLPGALFLSSLRLSRSFCLTVAPPISLALYGILEIVEQKLRCSGSFSSIAGPVFLLCFVVFVVNQMLVRSSNRRGSSFVSVRIPNYEDGTKTGLQIALPMFIAMGVLLTGFIFVRSLDGADSYSQLYDNAWHMGIVRKFLVTGNYSTLTSGDIVPTLGSTFYPTGWHSLVALVSDLVHTSPLVAANAVNAFILACVFPTSMYFMLTIIMPKLKTGLVLSAFTVMVFASFPWRFLTFGPLYSNLLSFAVLPLSIALFVIVLDWRTTKKNRLIAGFVLLLCLVGMVMTQPNVIFTVGILVVPYLFSQIPSYLRFIHTERIRKLTVVLVISAVFVMILLIWLGIYRLPFMQRTVTWQWPSIESVPQALMDITYVGFHDAEPQFLLGLLVLLGMVYTVVHREYLWITCAYAIMCFLYLLSSATDGRMKAVLTGFWYHDAYRLGAAAVLFAIPLSGIGMWLSIKVFLKMTDGILADLTVSKNQILISVILVILTTVVNCFPNYHLRGRYSVDTAMGAIVRDLTYTNSKSKPKSYTKQEEEFVAKVQKIVPNGEVILNQPYDGSVYAWSVNGLNVYYKAWQGNWMGESTKQNTIIRTSLSSLERDPHVCTTVVNSRAKYLMLLDRSDYKSDPDNKETAMSDYAKYVRGDWAGIDSVTDDTPGFTKVLSEGNMRLYKIDVEGCQSD